MADDSANAGDPQEQQRRNEQEAKEAEERRLKEQEAKDAEERRLREQTNTVAHMAPAALFSSTEGLSAAMLLTHMGKIDKLKGQNYPSWRKDIDMMFTVTEMDTALLTDKPTEPVPDEDHYDNKMMLFSIEKRKWEISNTKCLKIIRHLIDDSIEGSIPECATAKELLDRLKTQFTGSSKAYASALVDDFTNTRCDNSGVRAYIQKMTSTAAKLNKYLGKDLPEDFVVHMIMKSLPKEYETFHVHYNTTVKDRWTIDQLMAPCLQEEERLKSHKSDSVNYASNQSKKLNKNSKPYFKKKGDPGQTSGHASSKPPATNPNHGPMNYNHGRGKNPDKFFPVPINVCLHCKQEGHYKKDCPDWLRSLIPKDKGVQNKEDAGKGNKKR